MDADERRAIAADLDEMQAMVEATLAYVRGGDDPEAQQVANVASLLMAVADTSTDAGRDVAYAGPGRALAELVEAGKTGVLSGAGFYDWSGRAPAEWFEERDRRLVELRRALRRIGSLAGFREEGEEAP